MISCYEKCPTHGKCSFQKVIQHYRVLKDFGLNHQLLQFGNQEIIIIMKKKTALVD